MSSVSVIKLSRVCDRVKDRFSITVEYLKRLTVPDVMPKQNAQKSQSVKVGEAEYKVVPVFDYLGTFP
jgi:hypothetical protein